MTDSTPAQQVSEERWLSKRQEMVNTAVAIVAILALVALSQLMFFESLTPNGVGSLVGLSLASACAAVFLAGGPGIGLALLGIRGLIAVLILLVVLMVGGVVGSFILAFQLSALQS